MQILIAMQSGWSFLATSALVCISILFIEGERLVGERPVCDQGLTSFSWKEKHVL